MKHRAVLDSPLHSITAHSAATHYHDTVCSVVPLCYAYRESSENRNGLAGMSWNPPPVHNCSSALNSGGWCQEEKRFLTAHWLRRLPLITMAISCNDPAFPRDWQGRKFGAQIRAAGLLHNHTEEMFEPAINFSCRES